MTNQYDPVYTHTKDIMIAYVHSLGAASVLLFPKNGLEDAQTESFEATWERILARVKASAT
jgi:hypothetical protein